MRPLLLGLVALLLPAAAAAQSALDAVRARGVVACGVNGALPGFSAPGPGGAMAGLDAETCRAVAAAVLGDAGRVRFVPLAAVPEAIAALRAGTVDMLARNLTQTLGRDTEAGLSAAGVTFYDGQGFLGAAPFDLRDLSELDGRRVCVGTGTTHELTLADAAARGATVRPVPVEGFAGLRDAYRAGACEIATADASLLSVLRATALPDPAAHALAPLIATREPLGPFVRDGDPDWRRAVAWTVNALVELEVLGVTAANAAERRTDPDPRLRRLLGAEPGIGAPVGLDDGWVFRVATQVGNYGEVFARTLGPATPIGLARGLNAPYFAGGLHYPLPMR